MSSSNSTLWTKGTGESPLYSDWKVSFTTVDDSIKKDAESDSKGWKWGNPTPRSEDATVPDQRDQHESSEGQSLSHYEEQREECFSVHRNMIGPKSIFFTQCFMGKIQTKNSSNVIALPPDIPANAFASVVQAFELLLDYCYSGNADIELDTENAVAMFCLCNYFEMNSEICEKVHDFIKSDLSPETVAKYYQIIKDMRSTSKTKLVLDTQPILEMVVRMCYQEPSALSGETDLFKNVDLNFWLSIGSMLTNEDVESTESKVWSENITSFFDTYHGDDILELKETFQTLTSQSVLPEVSPEVALRLLELEFTYGLEIPTQDDKNAAPDVTEDNDDSKTDEEERVEPLMLTNLQERCIKALCDSNWPAKGIELKRGKLMEITTPAVLEALLIDSVTTKRAITANIDQMKADLDAEKKVLAKEVEDFNSMQEEAKYDVAREQEKQKKLQTMLDATRKGAEEAKKKLKKIEDKTEKEKDELRKANALLQAEIEKEKEKSEALRKRYRDMESAQCRIKSDREKFETTIKETIKQLEVLTSVNEPYGACGLGHIVMLMSSISDIRECRQIKKMLEQVVNPDYVLRGSKTNDDGTITDGESLFTNLTNDFSRI